MRSITKPRKAAAISSVVIVMAIVQIMYRDRKIQFDGGGQTEGNVFQSMSIRHQVHVELEARQMEVST